MSLHASTTWNNFKFAPCVGDVYQFQSWSLAAKLIDSKLSFVFKEDFFMLLSFLFTLNLQKQHLGTKPFLFRLAFRKKALNCFNKKVFNEK